jgi:hypothetical protein
MAAMQHTVVSRRLLSTGDFRVAKANHDAGTLRIGSFRFIISRKGILRSFLDGLSRKLLDIVYKSDFGWNSAPRSL